MLKKAITFTNIDGVTVTEEFHFQISQSDATKMLLVEGEDYQERIEKLTEERDGAKIIEHFENLLRAAVGKREGMRFVKNQEITDYFMQSGAYDSFFMELIRTPDSGATIVAGMFPKETQGDIKKAFQDRGITTVELPESDTSNVVTLQQPVDGISNDAQVQDEKPQPTFTPHPDLFPKNLERAIQQNQPVNIPPQGKDDDDPAWLKEGREPTRQEMMKMSKEDLQFVFKMREAGLLKK